MSVGLTIFIVFAVVAVLGTIIVLIFRAEERKAHGIGRKQNSPHAMDGDSGGDYGSGD